MALLLVLRSRRLPWHPAALIFCSLQVLFLLFSTFFLSLLGINLSWRQIIPSPVAELTVRRRKPLGLDRTKRSARPRVRSTSASN